MKKKISIVITIMMLCCMLFQTNTLSVWAEDQDVTITESEYDVYYPGVATNFLCNQKSIGSKPGTEYFMTYTVESVTECGLQGGLIGTSDAELEYPYTEGKGVMYYHQEPEGTKTNPLFLEGCTYLIKYEITENGFRYKAAKIKDDKAEYFTLNEVAAEGSTEDTQYKLEKFGIWVAGGITNLKLSHVRFYDKDGNDLGLYSKGNRVLIIQNAYTPKDTQIDHRYTIEAVDLPNLSVSNAKPLTTNKMFVEYTVKSSRSKCNQTGVALSNAPKEPFPHAEGLLKYYMDCSLLQVGADYLITLEKQDETFTAIVQITKNGKTTFSTFPLTYGTYNAKAKYFSLWFGEGMNLANFVLENVKIYDANKNNLGVQSNNELLKIEHFGELLDYSGCEAFYYCGEDGSYYALYANKTLYYAEGKKATKGTFAVSEGVITIKTSDKSEKCEYFYQHIKKEGGKKYLRLPTCKVSFVTGTEEKVDTQVLDATTGYIAQRPQEPKLINYRFEGWCLADGSEFPFETLVTESTTLYAKWSDNAGIEYLATAQGDLKAQKDYSFYWVIAGCVILVLVTVAGGVLMIRGGAKYGSRQKKEKDR